MADEFPNAHKKFPNAYETHHPFNVIGYYLEALPKSALYFPIQTTVRCDVTSEQAEIERLKTENAELRRDIGGFPHLADMRQCMVDTAEENDKLKARNEFLKKALDQAISLANIRLEHRAEHGVPRK